MTRLIRKSLSDESHVCLLTARINRADGSGLFFRCSTITMSAFETWKTLVWRPFRPPDKSSSRADGIDPYDVGARPLDPRFLPYAIVRNPAMVPSLIQNLNDYCDALTPDAFPEHQDALERIERAEKDFEHFQYSAEVSELFVQKLLFPVSSLLELLGHSVKPKAVISKLFVPGVVLSAVVKQPVTSASMLFVEDFSRAKDSHEFDTLDDNDFEKLDVVLNEMDRMVDEMHVFNYEQSPYLRKHKSLLVRVLSLIILYIFSLSLC
jgi:hypothetical protein